MTWKENVLFTLVFIFLVLLSVLTSAFAQEAPKLDEVSSLKIQKAQLQRSLLEERMRSLQTEAALIQIQYTQKGQEMDRIVEEAATSSGVELKDGWRPDPEAKIWKKK